MLCWENSCVSDLLLLDSIKILLKNRDKLLYFLFHPTKARLRAEPAILLKEAACFSSGEFFLIQIALDYWDGSGNARLININHILDEYSRLQVLESLAHLRSH